MAPPDILVGTRPFADKKPIRVQISDAEHGLLALLAKRAETAFGDLLTQARPIHLTDRSRQLRPTGHVTIRRRKRHWPHVRIGASA
jgi:hypothetical protein